MNELRVGVDTPGTPRGLDPRQEKFISLYCDPSSKFFGNCFQSAAAAGYSVQTARNLTHNRPAWLSEKLGQLQVMEPETLLLKLTAIIDNPREGTQNKLRAIDMMMKHFQMFGPQVARVQINIQNVLD